MSSDASERLVDDSKGLSRIALGSTVGLAAGIVGLVLPVTLFIFASSHPGRPYLEAAVMIQVAAVLALAGGVLFAISLTAYRLGFAALCSTDRRFWIASVLCILGTVGIVLFLLPIALAFTSSDLMAACIRGAPTKALVCLRSAAPLAAGVGLAGFWFLWLGGLGVVVGIGSAALLYRESWLMGGAGLYALLLLGFVAPILSLVFPLGVLVYPILMLPVLVLLAPAVISFGSHHALAVVQAALHPHPGEAGTDGPDPVDGKYADPTTTLGSPATDILPSSPSVPAAGGSMESSGDGAPTTEGWSRPAYLEIPPV